MNMENKNTPKTDQSTTKNSSRTPVGLIVASVATIAVSWGGMAAYMDYRLQQMENNLSDQSEVITVSVADSVDEQLKHFGAAINKNVNENSSVIAKGILDLSKQEEERFNKSLDELAAFGEKIETTHERVSQSVNQVLKEGQQQISQLMVSKLDENNNALSNKIDQSLQSQSEKTSQVISGLETILQQNQDSSEKLLTSIHNVDQQLDNTQNQLTQGFSKTAKSLEELATADNAKLAELASQVQSIASSWQTDHKKVSAELEELLNRVQDVRSEINSAKVELTTISSTIPEIQSSNEKQMELLSQSGSQEEFNQQISNVLNHVQDLTQKVDETSQNLLKAMYITNDGLKETTVEIKSEVATTQEMTAQQLENLSAKMQEINNAVENIMKSTPNIADSESQEAAFDHETNQAIQTQLKTVFDQIDGLQSRLVKKMNFAKNAVEQQIEYGADKNHTEFLNSMAKSFSEFTDELNGYFETINEKLGTVKNTIETPTSVAENQSEDVQQAEEIQEEISVNTDEGQNSDDQESSAE